MADASNGRCANLSQF